jgi:hypothetical protein
VHKVFSEDHDESASDTSLIVLEWQLIGSAGEHVIRCDPGPFFACPCSYVYAIEGILAGDKVAKAVAERMVDPSQLRSTSLY